MNKQYVTLNLENISKTPLLRQTTNRRYIWRVWRRLTRSQKNLFLITLACLFIFLYWIIWKYEPNINQVELSFPNELLNDAEELNQLTVKATVDRVWKIAEKDDEKTTKSLKRKLKTNKIRSVRQKAVVNAMLHAWKGYKKYAWGHDHLLPITATYQNWFKLGLTIVDSLDTLYLMDLHEEFSEGREWVESSFNLNSYRDVNLFEVTIRVLGGLLAAFHFSDDFLFLEKAADLGDRLLPCFTKSPTAIPYSDVNLATNSAHAPRWSPDSSTAEVTTIQLEFRDLSRSIDESKFESVASAVSEHVHKLPKHHGLVPIFINPNTGRFNSASDIKLGARGDSYYEYLLKQWIQTGKTVDYLRDDYIEAVEGIMEKLVKTTKKRKLVFIGELKSSSRDFSPKMDHLVCYLPGTLALGVHHGMPKSHMELALQLIETCYYMYADQPTFLSPEIVYFNYKGENGAEMYVHQNDAHNLLRPEFIESLWYLYQITGNRTYQDWGWKVFQAIERHCKVANGYTSIGNVLEPENTRPRDMMESFFLSETLKYFYLLFDKDRHVLSIDKYVINSEGHPLPVLKF